MLKFFRKIRQKLLNEGKLRKYLIYAIGEILLVMIGILLALQINIWNQNYTNRKEETKALINIQSDLDAQIQELNRFINYEESVLGNANSILSHFQENDGFINLDTLYDKINSLGSRLTIKPFNNTFSELNSSGTLDLIRSDSIRLKLIEYYQNFERETVAIDRNNTSLNTEIINSQFISITQIRPRSNLTKRVLSNQESIKKVYSKIVTVPYARFNAIVERQLSKEKNELIMVNLANLRMITSSAHISIMKERLELTKVLKESIANYMNGKIK